MDRRRPPPDAGDDFHAARNPVMRTRGNVRPPVDARKVSQRWSRLRKAPPVATSGFGALPVGGRPTEHVIADPPVPVTGFDTYEVLPGGYFLVHHVDVQVGNQPVRAIEIIGEPDPSSGSFLARSFDNTGSSEIMRVTIDDEGVFRFVGGPDVAPAAHPADGETAGVRSTLTRAADGGSMTALWERSADGHTWEPWMRISFRKLD